MSLTLTYFAEPSIPVEIEGFTPTWAQGRTTDEIGQFEIHHGNERLPLRQMFRIEGDAADGCLIFQGDLSGVHGIGSGLSEGMIRVEGNAGRHTGRGMSGGEIFVDANTGNWLGAEMRGGIIHVQGDAGDHVGAAYPGSSQGMAGGTILIDGNVGHKVGAALRRGLIAVGGAAGDMVGQNLLAGTVLVFGACGKYPGAGMRRGTIGLFGDSPPKLLPTFPYACTTRLQFLPLLFRTLRSHNFAVAEEFFSAEYDVYHGDQLSLGKGEILSRPQ